MTQVNLPYTLSDGQRSYAARVMANFEALANGTNEALAATELFAGQEGAANLGARGQEGAPETVQALLDLLAAGIAQRYTSTETDIEIKEATNDTFVDATLNKDAGAIIFTKKDGSTVVVDIGSSVAGVSAFNGRSGAVLPEAGDYTPEMVGAVSADDSRLTDAREPVSHGASHGNGGSDPVTPADIGAEAATVEVAEGTEIMLADKTRYMLVDVSSLAFFAPSGNFGCYGAITTAESGDITVTLPTGAVYMGDIPSFANDETWEFSCWNNRWVWAKAEVV